MDFIGKGAEPSSSRFHAGLWYSDIDPDRDYATGADERHSYHLEGFTEEEERAIFDEITGK